MKSGLDYIVTASVLGMLAGTAAGARAESATAAGAPGSETAAAAAHLKLRVVVPRFLHLRVGRAGRAVDTIAFEPAAQTVGDGRVVQGSRGNAGGGSADVELRSNAGQITIVADNDGGVAGLGSSGAISMSDVTVRSDSAALQSPQLTDTGGAAVSAALTGGDITERKAAWTYEYSNARVVEPGSYRAGIVYTAVSP